MDTHVCFMTVFSLKHEYQEAFHFCTDYNLHVNTFEHAGRYALLFFDPSEVLIFTGWAGQRFIMSHHWFKVSMFCVMYFVLM